MDDFKLIEKLTAMRDELTLVLRKLRGRKNKYSTYFKSPLWFIWTGPRDT